MATVTDSSLLTAAQQIVSEFMDGATTLNNGVIKVASDLGLNTDQTQRLIERTNTEAFLRVYPNDTEFEVASPEVVLGIKTASITPAMNVPVAEDGLFKAASVNKVAAKSYSGIPSGAGRTYQGKIDAMTEADIFGMDEEFFKEAAATKYENAIDHEALIMNKTICDMTKTASELEQERIAYEEKVEAAYKPLFEHIKQASLSGTQSIRDGEEELFNMYPEHTDLVAAVYDDVVTKLAAANVVSDKLERGRWSGIQKWAHRSDLTDKFEKLLKAVM